MKQLEIQKHILSLSGTSLKKFISEMHDIPMLTIEEEQELIHRIRKGGIEAEQACEVLAKSYLRYIAAVAKEYEHQDIPVPKLLSYGITGLIRSAEKYDETRGFKFLSYTIWWIRQAMQNAIIHRSRAGLSLPALQQERKSLPVPRPI